MAYKGSQQIQKIHLNGCNFYNIDGKVLLLNIDKTPGEHVGDMVGDGVKFFKSVPSGSTFTVVKVSLGTTHKGLEKVEHFFRHTNSFFKIESDGVTEGEQIAYLQDGQLKFIGGYDWNVV